jgi:hypothetical protein
MTDMYQVLIVEQTTDEQQATTLHPAPFETGDAGASKCWADAFNERELAEPVGLWAVVRRPAQ